MEFPVSVTLYFGFFAILSPNLVLSKANLDTLRLTQIIFRHGARTIDQTYPTDPYKNESFWAPGYSQLNNLGKLQGHNLGLFLRDWYDGFVKNTYDMKDVYVRSSDVVRTMQTASSVMAGFYLPNQILDKDNETYYLTNHQVEIPLPWKSVPIHTSPVEYDNILRQLESICPRYQQLYANLPKESERMKNIFQVGRDISEYFYNHTGVHMPTTMKEVLQTVDTLYLEQYYNLTLSDWITQLISSEKATNFFLTYFEMITYTDEMKRLRAGPLLENLVQNMIMNETLLKDEFARSTSGQKKIYFFSGHDHTLASLLNTLGIFNKKRPPFTAAVMVELHQPNNKSNDISHQEYFVEVHYRNETDREPYQLEIPGCGLRCPLSEFITLAEKYIPQNWSLECQALKEPSSLSAGWIVLIVLSVWILLFIILQFWLHPTCYGYFSKRKRQSTYTNIK